MLLTAAGVRQVRGKEGIVEPGVEGSAFGFLNHALGMVAGVLLALAVARPPSRRIDVIAAGVALLAFVAAFQVGVHRWA